MAICALTIDFWNTMVVARTNGRRRQEQRLEHLLGTVRACHPETTETTVQEAYQEAATRFKHTWEQHHATPTTSELVRCIWDVLDLDVDETLHQTTVRVFEEGLLFGPPDFVEGLADTLAWAAERYRLGIISDTMFSPGRVIRRLLDQRGVLHLFDAFVFSDETGFSKPDTRAFERAATTLGVALHETVHIGDLRRTDVAGAQEAGVKAILFTGVHEDPDTTPAPNAILSHWHSLPDILHQFNT